MSWYIGSQLNTTSSGRTPNPLSIADRLAARFAWLTMTPLGVPVDPDVYWRNARSRGSGPVAAASGSPSVAYTGTGKPASSGTSGPVVNAAAAAQSSTTAVMRSSFAPGRGGYSGT